MSRTKRRTWEEDKEAEQYPYHTRKVIKTQEGRNRGISMGCPEGRGCSWCEYKTKKYYDIKSGVNDWKV